MTADTVTELAGTARSTEYSLCPDIPSLLRLSRRKFIPLLPVLGTSLVSCIEIQSNRNGTPTTEDDGSLELLQPAFGVGVELSYIESSGLMVFTASKNPLLFGKIKLEEAPKTAVSGKINPGKYWVYFIDDEEDKKLIANPKAEVSIEGRSGEESSYPLICQGTSFSEGSFLDITLSHESGTLQGKLVAGPTCIVTEDKVQTDKTIKTVTKANISLITQESTSSEQAKKSQKYACGLWLEFIATYKDSNDTVDYFVAPPPTLLSLIEGELKKLAA